MNHTEKRTGVLGREQIAALALELAAAASEQLDDSVGAARAKRAPMTDDEIREAARALDARASIKAGVPAIATCMTCRRKRHRPKLKVVTGDALSPGAMKLARAYDAATPDQRRCMDAVAAVAFVMSGDDAPGVAS